MESAGQSQVGAPRAPSRSTAYVSNLPFSLTNNDIHKIFEKFGRLVKVTVMKDKVTRRSRGVAFLLFLERQAAEACVAATNNSILFGRKLAAQMARENGRAAEFVKRREYPDKTRCYECGQLGHLSYSCEKNILGTRPPPKKRAAKRKKALPSEEQEEEDFEEESLSAAIRYSQQLRSGEEESRGEENRRRYKEAYFSDEEELE